MPLDRVTGQLLYTLIGLAEGARVFAHLPPCGEETCATGRRGRCVPHLSPYPITAISPPETT